MRGDWKIVQVKEVCGRVSVGHVGPSSMHRQIDGVPFLMGKNIGAGFLKLEKLEYVTHEFHTQQKKSQLAAGDIVVVRIGESGQAAKIPTDLAEANCSGLVILKQPKKIIGDFLVYFLNSPVGRRQSLNEAKGATRRTLNTKSVASALLPLPPLPEQERIVSILDKAFEGIDKAIAQTEQNLASARELFESYLNNIFTQKGEDWVEKKLGDVVNENNIGLIKGKREQGSDREFAYVKMNNIGNDNSFFPNSITRVEATTQEIEKYQLQDYDFLFNTRNSQELVGKTCLFRDIGESPVLYNNNIMRIRFKDELNPSFVSFAFSSSSVKKQLESMKSGTTNVFAIYYKSLTNLILCYPDVSRQSEISTQLEAIRKIVKKLEALYTQKLNDLKELKQSLLQQAFAGELTKEDAA